MRAARTAKRRKKLMPVYDRANQKLRVAHKLHRMLPIIPRCKPGRPHQLAERNPNP